MKILTTLLITACISLCSLSQAQQASIQGQVNDENGNPIPYANVILRGTQLGSATDDNGAYTISNVAPGSYTIQATFVGYRELRKEISLSAGESLTVNFSLVVADVSLQTVEITGREEQGYQNEISFAATKTATRLKDLPQAVSYVTKEVMAARQAYRVNDVVKNISGINQFSWYNDYTIRGFRSQQELINGLRVIGLFGPQILTANLERVEVIKGPASAVFGNSSPGGTMNRVTKKPLFDDKKAISFTT
ncbi:MAG: TonB-dependent receptor, partial [Bacteroidota bacterium]